MIKQMYESIAAYTAYLKRYGYTARLKKFRKYYRNLEYRRQSGELTERQVYEKLLASGL